MSNIEKLAKMMKESKRTVFFGGAGVSTESGIPDFRSAQGLYHQKRTIPPETILSHSFFFNHPDIFYQFYREHLLVPMAHPNDAHRALAKLEKNQMLSCVITQNIDGLHQLAGSQQVIELHGSTQKYFCIKCNKSYDADTITQIKGVPYCACGGIIKPDVVLYEEQLNEDAINFAIQEIKSCNLLIVGGTSLQVYPAAGFVRLCVGSLVIINRDPTPFDRHADLVIQASIGQTFRAVMELVGLPLSD